MLVTTRRSAARDNAWNSAARDKKNWVGASEFLTAPDGELGVSLVKGLRRERHVRLQSLSHERRCRKIPGHPSEQKHQEQ